MRGQYLVLRIAMVAPHGHSKGGKTQLRKVSLGSSTRWNLTVYVDQLLISSIVRKIIPIHSLHSGGKDCVHM